MASGSYSARDAGGGELASGECEVTAGAAAVTISPVGDAPLHLPYQQVVRLEEADYRLLIALEDGTAIEVSRLGKMLGDLLRQARDARNEVWEHGLFLHGVRRVDAFSCEVTAAGAEPLPAEVRLYEDRLSVLPERGDPFGLPCALVREVSFDGAAYRTVVQTAGGEELTFGKLRQRSTEFPGLLNELLAASRRRTAATLAEYLPELPAVKLQALARLMGDGVAARRQEIEAIDPGS